MLKYMDEGKQTLEREIDKILKTGDISVSTLEKLHKLTDTYKNLCKIYMLSEAEAETHAVIVWVDILPRMVIPKKVALIVAALLMTTICPMQEAVKVAAEVKAAEADKAVVAAALPMRADIPETMLKIG